MRKRADLPHKACATCGRPFAWRKKWAAVWDAVRHCSDRCRAARGADAPVAGAASGADRLAEAPSGGRAAKAAP